MEKAITITFISLLIVITTVFVLTVTEQTQFIDIVFESVSAFGTVGLSTGITGSLSSPGRLMIIVTMLTGRIGPLTLLFCLKEVKPRGRYRYPEENIMLS